MQCLRVCCHGDVMNIQNWRERDGTEISRLLWNKICGSERYLLNVFACVFRCPVKSFMCNLLGIFWLYISFFLSDVIYWIFILYYDWDHSLSFAVKFVSSFWQCWKVFWVFHNAILCGEAFITIWLPYLNRVKLQLLTLSAISPKLSTSSLGNVG